MARIVRIVPDTFSGKSLEMRIYEKVPQKLSGLSGLSGGLGFLCAQADAASDNTVGHCVGSLLDATVV